MDIVYIAGYGRSGSTILDILLGNHDDIFSSGELSFLFSELKYDRKCACGEEYSKCIFWREVLKDIKLDYKEAESSIREIENRSFFKRISQESINNYKCLNEIIFKHITVNYSLVIDSSKTAGFTANRPVALAKHLNANVKVIHLKRSFKSTIKTIYKKGSNWNLEGHKLKKIPAFRALLGYLFAHFYAIKAKFTLGNENYIYIKYEDLLDKPSITIDRISNFLQVDLSSLKMKVLNNNPLSIGHNVGGNRLRKKDKLIFRTNNG